eukprot:TRINITY_DN9831_c0_g1_i1.p1 TRINITY_DN9831_c0_g1~~TRINITY_DN9831_c0_g1_i1.p1  ORF type:complete len:185 (+),score=20.58 TRINITY_DN9831_c0_g1_i1:196-750(+)
MPQRLHHETRRSQSAVHGNICVPTWAEKHAADEVVEMEVEVEILKHNAWSSLCSAPSSASATAAPCMARHTVNHAHGERRHWELWRLHECGALPQHPINRSPHCVSRPDDYSAFNRTGLHDAAHPNIAVRIASVVEMITLYFKYFNRTWSSALPPQHQRLISHADMAATAFAAQWLQPPRHVTK